MRIVAAAAAFILALGVLPLGAGAQTTPPPIPTQCKVVDANNVTCAIDMGTMAPGTSKTIVLVVVDNQGNTRTETINVTASIVKSSTFDGKTTTVELQNPNGIKSLTIEVKP